MVVGRSEKPTQNRPGFSPQHAIGPYILDFYCVKAKLAIEVDGEVHTRNEQRLKDQVRDAYLGTLGIDTHRIVARDLLMNPDETIAGVIEVTLERMAQIKIPLSDCCAGTFPVNGEGKGDIALVS